MLDVEDLTNVSIEELASVLDPENPIERMQFRRGSSTSNVIATKSFVKLNAIRFNDQGDDF